MNILNYFDLSELIEISDEIIKDEPFKPDKNGILAWEFDLDKDEPGTRKYYYPSRHIVDPFGYSCNFLRFPSYKTRDIFSDRILIKARERLRKYRNDICVGKEYKPSSYHIGYSYYTIYVYDIIKGKGEKKIVSSRYIRKYGRKDSNLILFPLQEDFECFINYISFANSLK